MVNVISRAAVSAAPSRKKTQTSYVPAMGMQFPINQTVQPGAPALKMSQPTGARLIGAILHDWHERCKYALTLMNTSLKHIALLLSSSIAAVFSAEFAGLAVPSALDPLHLFEMLVVSLVLLILQADYGVHRSALGRFQITAPPVSDPTFEKADHPLAA